MGKKKTNMDIGKERDIGNGGHTGETYGVAKTHRMPGRAASGRALAPEPAARHRGRTPGPADFSEFFFPLFFALFLRSDGSHQKSEIGLQLNFNVRSQIGEKSDLRNDGNGVRSLQEMES